MPGRCEVGSGSDRVSGGKLEAVELGVLGESGFNEDEVRCLDKSESRETVAEMDGQAQVHKDEKKFVQKDVGAGQVNGLWIMLRKVQAWCEMALVIRRNCNSAKTTSAALNTRPPPA